MKKKSKKGKTAIGVKAVVGKAPSKKKSAKSSRKSVRPMLGLGMEMDYGMPEMSARKKKTIKY